MSNSTTGGGGGGGAGDVVGPASSTDNTAARWDSTTGKLLQDGTIVHTDNGESLAGSGSATNPSYSFASDTNHGFYLVSPSIMGYSNGGLLALFTTSSFTGNASRGGVLKLTASSLSSCGHTFNGDTNTGMHSPGADQLDLVTGGVAALQIDASQRVTKPLQPAFLAYLGTTDSGVTGNNTTYTLGSGNALTEVFDQGGDFDVGGSSAATFTAPVAGRYMLTVKFAITNISNFSQAGVQIITSNRTYELLEAYVPTSQSSVAREICILADMDAADTATYTIAVAGDGADNGNAIGASDMRNAVSGYLVA